MKRQYIIFLVGFILSALSYSGGIINSFSSEEKPRKAIRDCRPIFGSIARFRHGSVTRKLLPPTVEKAPGSLKDAETFIQKSQWPESNLFVPTVVTPLEEVLFKEEAESTESKPWYGLLPHQDFQFSSIKTKHFSFMVFVETMHTLHESFTSQEANDRFQFLENVPKNWFQPRGLTSFFRRGVVFSDNLDRFKKLEFLDEISEDELVQNYFELALIYRLSQIRNPNAIFAPTSIESTILELSTTHTWSDAMGEELSSNPLGELFKIWKNAHLLSEKQRNSLKGILRSILDKLQRRNLIELE